MPAFAATLRPARTDDAALMAAMSRDHIETGLGWRYSALRMRRLMRQSETQALGTSVPEGPVLGFAVMHFGDQQAHLLLLCVQPPHRRRGLAERLLDWLAQSARVAGITSVQLELRADNAGACAFYRRQGFTDIGMVPDYYAPGVSARRMQCSLRTTDEPPAE